ncbi:MULTISPECIES: TIM barrel protein [Mesorhizobium]|uniref:TIM barrel protein n=1 Tax=Mesorhizobium sp. AA22 TaxID=1854057 RepID=UPI001FDECF5B|nr:MULTISPECIES: TIM barrel protein [Mesorhizobium]
MDGCEPASVITDSGDVSAGADVRSAAAEAGVGVISINALQRFNEWTPARKAEASKLADYAAACGAKTLMLVPVNDGSWPANGERRGDLRFALKALKPILQSRGLIGLIEPLGFQTCSLRSKNEAAKAIAAIDGQSVFRLVHDTFHHTLAGEPFFSCDLTGLVHISRVNDPIHWIYPDRVLFGSDNGSQIRALLDGGYAGPFSFAPFVDAAHPLDDLAGALSATIISFDTPVDTSAGVRRGSQSGLATLFGVPRRTHSRRLL